VVSAASLQFEFSKAVEEFGSKMRFQYFVASGAAANYDDNVAYTQTGSTVWCNGIINIMTSTQGSNDAILLERGRVLQSDLKVYVGGSINTSGIFTVGLGSPVTQVYTIIPQGTDAPMVDNTPIYKMMFLRALTTGSLQ
jgi:hypothetical protein